MPRAISPTLPHARHTTAVDVAQADGARRNVEDLLAEAAWMRALARRLVRDDESADDLVQDTWLAALKLSPIAREKLRPWLAHVLANFARAKHRADARRSEREWRSACSEALPSAADGAVRIEAQRALVEALASLDEPYRSTVIMRYFDGLSSADIARCLRVPAGTVRWRLKHAVEELRDKLDRRYGGDRGAWSLVLLPFARSAPLAKLGSAPMATIQGVFLMHALARVGIVAAAAALVAAGLWVSREGLRPKEVATEAIRRDEASLQRDLDAHVAPVLAAASASGSEARVPVTVEKLATSEHAAEVGRLEARFVDGAHRPLPGVTLVLDSNVEEAVLRGGPSSADGRVAIELALTEPTRPTHYRTSCAGRASRFGVLVWEKDGTTHLGDLVLESGGTVRGIVVRPDGTPAANADVLVTTAELDYDVDVVRRRGPRTNAGVPSTRTRSDGAFEIDGVPAAVVRVWAHAADMRYSLTQPVEVHAGEVHDGVRLELEPSAPDDRITGIVRAPDGTLVSGANIEYWFHGPRMTGGMTIVAERDGRFELDLEQKVPYALHVRDTQDRWAEIHAARVDPGTHDLELRFSEPRFLVRHVRAEGDRDLPRFSVRLKCSDERALEEGLEFTHALGPSLEGSTAEGLVSVRVPTQPFLIEVSALGFALARLGPFVPEAVEARLECTLTAVPGVSGRVVAEGHSIAAARVELVEMCSRGERFEVDGFLRRLQGVVETATTDAEGNFRFTAQAGGRLAILCDADGFATAELSPLVVDPKIGAKSLEIVLSPGGILEGRVLVSQGIDPAGTMIELSRADGRRHSMRVGPDGAYRFERLTPGRWQVRHTPAGEMRRSAAILMKGEQDDEEIEVPWNALVAEGQTTRHDVDLRAPTRCVLAAHVSIDGKPAVGWRIVLWPDPHPPTMLAPPAKSIGEDGSARIEAAATGAHRIVLGPPEEWGSNVQVADLVSLVPGENAWQLDLRTGRLEGRIGPVNRTKQLYFDWRGSGDQSLRAEIRFDAEGEFRLPLVPLGRGSIEGYDPHAGENARWTKLIDVDVTAGGVQRVELP
jgi:RNA polymerase sigma-70 factor (ECF subfamily)